MNIEIPDFRLKHRARCQHSFHASRLTGARAIIALFTGVVLQAHANEPASAPDRIDLAQVIGNDVPMVNDAVCYCTAPDGRRFRDLYGGDCPDPDSGRAIYDCGEAADSSEPADTSSDQGTGTIELADPDELEPIDNPDEAFFIALDHFNGRNGRVQDDKMALKLAMRAAEQGHTDAQNLVGVIYSRGQGVTRDYTRAFEWKLKAAKAGNPMAQKNVGWHFESGKGTPRDYNKAVRWYRQSAQGGFPLGMRALGFMYQNGFGVQQSYDEALSWYQRAADRGDAEAMNDIGYLYQKGWGVAQDYAIAATWYRRSAEKGHSIAMKNLASLYEVGTGVQKDPEQARYWRDRAERQ